MDSVYIRRKNVGKIFNLNNRLKSEKIKKTFQNVIDKNVYSLTV